MKLLQISSVHLSSTVFLWEGNLTVQYQFKQQGDYTLIDSHFQGQPFYFAADK